MVVLDDEANVDERICTRRGGGSIGQSLLVFSVPFVCWTRIEVVFGQEDYPTGDYPTGGCPTGGYLKGERSGGAANASVVVVEERMNGRRVRAN